MILSLSMELFYYIMQETALPKPILVKAVFCFSPYINLKKIIKTVDANAVGQVGCLTGMRLVLKKRSSQLELQFVVLFFRVFSMSWVILAHVFGFLPGQWCQNELYSWNVRKKAHQL